jgi:hypothetical protein
MRQLIYCSILFLYTTLNVFSQNSLDDLNIITKHDFERNTVGKYLRNEWAQDWPTSIVEQRIDQTEIAQDATDIVNPTKCVQFNYPAGSLGPDQGGAQWWDHFDKQDELYISYDLKFMPGFKYVLGGKLPSVTGGEYTNFLKPTGYDGFTGGLMFKGEHQIVFYIYYPDSNFPEGGTSFTWGGVNYPTGYFSPSSVVVEYGSGKVCDMYPGEWHNITYRMVMNTVKSGGGGNFDGILEAYFDGVLVTQLSHMLFRHTTDLGIDCLKMYSFFGGGTDDWRNPIDEWLRVDNVIMYTFKQGFDVPRGNTLSPKNRTINYWRKMLDQSSTIPNAPSNIGSKSISSGSATITWNDNSNNEYGFEIYRSLSANKDFVKVGTAVANTTSIINTSLLPNTTYYYMVRSYNGKGFSDYTPPLTVLTLPMALPPTAPSGLIVKSFDDKNVILSWKDNSNDEYGFEVFRSLSQTSGFTLIGTTPANVIEYINTGLVPNTTYYYYVRSYNGNGKSANAPTIKTTTSPLAVPPSPPSGLRANNSVRDSVMLQWDDNSNNEVGFLIEKSESDSNHFVILYTSQSNQVKFTDRNIKSNSAFYRIKSFNNNGYSSYSKILKIIFNVLIELPNAPLNLSLFSFGFDNVSLKWEDNSDNETGFEILRRGPDDMNIVNFFKVDANGTSYINQRLQANAKYIYYVRALNINGYSAYSNEIIAQTLDIKVPQAPSAFKVINNSLTSTTLEWKDNSKDESAFYIKRSLIIDTNDVKIITLKANATSFTDTALKPNTDFFYQVFASNQAGISAPSNKVIATTLSVIESNRVKDGLIAYYNFHYYPDNIIRDISGYKEPLNLQILDPGSVAWNDNNSLEILKPTTVASNGPATKLINAYKNSNEMTIECWIKPSEPSIQSSSKIVSLGASDSDLGFVLSQDYANLQNTPTFNYSVRLHTTSANKSGYPEFSLNQDINFINLQHIVYTRDILGKEKIYLNGTKYDESSRPYNFEDWNNNYYLTIANVFDQNSPWVGSLYTVALYNKALSISQVYTNYIAGPIDKLIVNKPDYEIDVFPNPVIEEATIKIVPVEVQDIAPETFLRIINAFGTIYYEEVLFNPGSLYTKSINFSNYPKGIYLVQILSNDKEQSLKFMIR